jgi:hypothetical protein
MILILFINQLGFCKIEGSMRLGDMYFTIARLFLVIDFHIKHV